MSATICVGTVVGISNTTSFGAKRFSPGGGGLQPARSAVGRVEAGAPPGPGPVPPPPPPAGAAAPPPPPPPPPPVCAMGGGATPFGGYEPGGGLLCWGGFGGCSKEMM